MFDECTRRGQPYRFDRLDPDETYRHRPRSENRTRRKPAFDGEGISL